MPNFPRIRRLIEVLEQVEREARPFNMDVWVANRDQKGDRVMSPPLLDVPVESCGTAACALGWAARDPVLRAQGLSLGPDNGATGFTPTFGFNRGFHAGTAFFEIDYALSAAWFGPRASYDPVTPRMVIERIYATFPFLRDDLAPEASSDA